MKPCPTPTSAPRFLCFIFFAFLIIISCSKDNDGFQETVLGDSSIPVEETVKETTTEEEQEKTEEEQNQDATEEKAYETRTTIFQTINDAHLQDDTGYNQEIVRIEEGRRTSYLMFDLSPIDSIGGTVNTTKLKFTIASDDGSGTISVFKAHTNEWSEKDLSAKTAPETKVLVGELVSQYELAQTEEIVLDTTFVRNEVLTLILTHNQGNDLAFASKENPNGQGPALIVTYSAPQDAEAIVFDNAAEITPEADVLTETNDTDTAEENAVNSEVEDTEEETTEEETTEEETAEEETTKEETTAEETTAEETAEVETAVAETTEEETTAEEATEEETTKVETTEEETTEEETTKQETTQEETTKVETTEEETTKQETTQEETTKEETTQEETNNKADAPQNEEPNAVAEASPSNGNAPLKVSFKGSASSDDQGVKRYVWDFRDGSTSTEANPTHTFEKTGTLEVRLTVTDAQGASDTDTVTITISKKEEENRAPIAVATADPTSGEATLNVQFTSSDSNDDKGIKSYFWDFKDGSSSTSANPSHSFSKAGTYQVELSVTDEEGAKDSQTVTIEISEKENQAPVAVAGGAPLTGDAPLNVEFNAWDSKDDQKITGYFWDFKDGSTTTSINPSHSFSEPGEYDVELSVKDAEGLTHATTIKVKVNARPADSGDTGNGSGDNGGSNENGSGDGNDGNSDGGTGTTSTSSGDNSGNYPSNAVFASSFGFKSGDATAAFEAAINSGSSFVVIDKQSSDWVIRPTRFFDLQNMTIVFEPGVVLRAKRGAFIEGKRLFKLTRAKNVTIEGTGATFKMNKNEYTSGEQRHAFEMTMCSDITVRGLTLRDSGGAGIKLSGNDNDGYCQNITLENIRCLNNRRDGITITSAQDVWVRNSEFSGSSGTRPEAGVVLEADHPGERLVNINFINCKISDNESAGFHFAGVKMNSGTRPISIKVVDSEFSNNAIAPPSGFHPTEVEVFGGQGTSVVGGEIRFERVKFNGSRGRIVFSRKSGNGFKAVFKDCEARNVVTSTAVSPIGLEANHTRNTLGGMVFDNFNIQYNRNVPFMEIRAPSFFQLKDLRGSFTINEPGDNPLSYVGSYQHQTHKNINVSINYKHN